ncbi:uncharacterized protein E0L32_007981 [Thyridium curvatum]|uniref:beta-glucosidase n=1 Tax=Thyridium curvatum TaxID=1093900 RepID=A0A507B3F1_9PEZI|nr:uncharacterized protein E0L32_007981 [Thyridium curvatum]TPX11120.1 hypothetical protein E0L32_007981 [Thyridium curvatum]
MDSSAEGLLRPRDKSRPSYEPETSDSESDIDATEFLTSDPLYSQSRSNSSPSEPTFINEQRLRQRWRFFSLRRPRSKCCIALLVVLGVLLFLILASGGFVYKKYNEEPPYGQSPPWYPSPKGGTAKSWADSYKAAAELVSKMTLPEKVNVTTGTGWMMGLAVGATGSALRVGFPQLHLQDGPLGIRGADNATAFPAGITVGATWNKELMFARGKAHAQEARAKGIHVILGPAIGPLGRMPAGGRNWEGFGPDPYLQGIAGGQTIRGIQSEGIMATIKHFVANEQEHFRQPWEWGLPHAISTNIDDRTLHEIYAWPFADAIKAGVASVMCSYNMVNNSYACDNSKLLNGILKDEMGFQGFVMSDWLAQRSGVASALAGLDMTMPGDGLKWQDGHSLWGPELSRAVLNGSIPMDRLNDMVTRIVAAWYQLGQDDKSKFDNKGPNFSSWSHEKVGVQFPGSPSPQDKMEINKFVPARADHDKIARQVAAEGTVLLKNDDCLPIDRDGSMGINGQRRKRDGTKLKVGIFGEDAGPGRGANYCKDRGCNQGTLGMGWGSGAVEYPYLIPPVDALREGFDSSKVELSEYLTNTPGFGKDPNILGDKDVCMVFGNADSGEGFLAWGSVGGDRNDLFLQKGGDELIKKVAEGCGGGKGQTIVVIHSVGPVVMDRWVNLPTVKAVLQANLPGQESGNALAELIFGDTSPSGKLPYTIGKSLDDYGPGAKIMYLPNGVIPQQDFSEGLYIDYRHFDKYNIEPRFPFGHGLSYTTFEISNLVIEGLKTKSAMPSPRPNPGAAPPEYDNAIPDPQEALFPPEVRKIEKYVYPYLDSVEGIDASVPYPLPEGYDVVQPPSGAGGDQGGNPDLWETYVRVTVDVKNTGKRAGKVVPQLYVAYPQGARETDFPVKVLRGFEKVLLKPGEKRTVEFNLTRRDLSYWDVYQQNWVVVMGGQYTLLVGQSSRDTPLSGLW